ncbi:FAD-dependent urate hydroxylase [Coccomyxa sp. Obi]|nr:FAD-dependent urate hydroxylase [Coccomyxa sp. Obi]
MAAAAISSHNALREQKGFCRAGPAFCRRALSASLLFLRGAMLTLSRQMHVFSALAACIASLVALLYLGQFAGFGDVLLSALLWGGLALCIMLAVPVLGSKNAPRTRASMKRAKKLAIYDSANEAEQAGTAAAKAKENAPIPGQLAFAAQPLHTDPAVTARFGKTENAVVVVGAGIAGLSAAASLHKVGIPAVVLEREGGPRQEGSAITFWPNAFRVLDALGVAAPVRETHALLHRVEIVNWDGEILRSFGLDECEGAPHDARIVRRNSLLNALRTAVPDHLVHYGVSIAAVHETESGAVVELSNGERLPCKAVVGCDGVKSRIAASLGLKPACYAGEVYYRGVATFPVGVPEAPGTLRMIWSERGVRVGISTISRTECFWFTTLTCPEEVKQETPEKRQADALASVSGFCAHIEAAIKHTPPAAISRSRIVDRWLRADRPVGRGCITVAGDALHPMTPSLGQGGCIALEDGVMLAKALVAAGGASAPAAAVAEALRGYEAERVARAMPVTVKSHIMGAMLQIRNSWFAFARNLVVKNFYPVHSFLKPAAFDCGTLEPRAGISTSELLARTTPSLICAAESGVGKAQYVAASQGQPRTVEA